MKVEEIPSMFALFLHLLMIFLLQASLYASLHSRCVVCVLCNPLPSSF